MEDGAVGFSTGLSYYPASYAGTDELIELCKVVKEYDGVFMIHLRTEFPGERFDPDWEAMEIARKSGVRLHISHIKTGQDTIGRPDILLKGYADAQNDGVDVSFELYPYHAGSGFLLVLLPGWALEGGYEATLDRLNNEKIWEKMQPDVAQLYENIFPGHDIVITNIKNQKDYTGRLLTDIARESSLTPLGAIRQLLLDNDLEVGVRGHLTMSPQEAEQLDMDLLTLLSMPNYMVGSDSCPAGEKPHPRAFGTFPKLLRLARERNFPLETLINRMTKTPAERFRLAGRGKVDKGMFADIVIFDPGTVSDHATWEKPRGMPSGIEYVLVNGRIALREGKVTGILAGKALKRNEGT
jgi:N-acyl-D-amino-acid deacylase